MSLCVTNFRRECLWKQAFHNPLYPVKAKPKIWEGNFQEKSKNFNKRSKNIINCLGRNQKTKHCLKNCQNSQKTVEKASKIIQKNHSFIFRGHIFFKKNCAKPLMHKFFPYTILSIELIMSHLDWYFSRKIKRFRKTVKKKVLLFRGSQLFM